MILSMGPRSAPSVAVPVSGPAHFALLLATAATLLLLGPVPAAGTEGRTAEGFPVAKGSDFGAAVAAVGDVNGDGRGDFLVTVSFGDPMQGGDPHPKAILYSGRDGSVIRYFRIEGGDFLILPACVAGCGDLNGDGFPEVVLGQTVRNKVMVFSGKDGELLGEFWGPVREEQIGGILSVLGPTKEDSDPLIALSPNPGPWHTRPTVRVFSLRSGKERSTVQGPQIPGKVSTFGRSLAPAGDVDGDGFPDFVAGDPAGSCGRLVSGKSGKLIREFAVEGVDLLGEAVASMGDVDGDGTGDFALSYPSVPKTDLEGRASVFVFSGATGKVLYRIPSDYRWGFGTTLASGHDLNGDGVQDLLVGSPQLPGGGKESVGLVHVHSGKDGRLLRKLEGTGEGSLFGWSLALSPDVNGDGAPDIIVGAPRAPVGKVERAGQATVYHGRTFRVLRELNREPK